MKEIKKIGILSLAKIQTTLMFVVGLLFILITVITNALMPITQRVAITWQILLIPVIYAIIGFIMGVLIAWVYNIFAANFGGVEIDLK